MPNRPWWHPRRDGDDLPPFAWDDLIPPETDVLLALIRVYDRDGRATIRDVAAEVDRSVAVTWKHLRRLQRVGLASSDAIGALRPLVRPVGIRR